MTQGRKLADDQIPDLVVGTNPTSKRRHRAKEAFEPQGFNLELEGICQPTHQVAIVTDGSIDLDDLGDLAVSEASALELAVAARNVGSVKDPAQLWPSAVTPARIELHPEQLRRVSPFGESPEHLFQTPVYAWLVYQQQTKLKHDASEAQRRLEQAEAERDASLANWLFAARTALAQDERFACMFEAVAAEEQDLAVAKSDLERTQAEVARDQQEYASAGSELSSAHETAAAHCQVESALCADAERALAREQAKRKRIDIEARADLGVNAATLNTRIADADRAIWDASERLELCRQNLSAAQRKHEAVRLELRRFEDRKDRVGREVSHHQHRVQQDLAAMERLLTQKKADIGRAILALRDRRCIDDPTRELLLHYDAEVLRLATEYQCLLGVMNTFDRQAVKRGLQLSIGTLGLGLLLVLLGILL